MEKHVLMFLGNDLCEVYAMPSPRNARRFCVGVQVYKPCCQAFMKASECSLPAADGPGIAFEFERALDKCVSAGFSLWPDSMTGRRIELKEKLTMLKGDISRLIKDRSHKGGFE